MYPTHARTARNISDPCRRVHSCSRGDRDFVDRTRCRQRHSQMQQQQSVQDQGIQNALSMLESNSLASSEVVNALRQIYQNLGTGAVKRNSPDDLPRSKAMQDGGKVCGMYNNDLSMAYSHHAGLSNEAQNSSEPKSEKPKSRSDAQRQFKPPSSKRQQLTPEEAAEIYDLRPKADEGSGLRRGSMLKCKAIAPKYGVSAKTIRDVWRGRTWTQATEHLWTPEEKAERAQNNQNESDSEPSVVSRKTSMKPASASSKPQQPTRTTNSQPPLPNQHWNFQNPLQHMHGTFEPLHTMPTPMVSMQVPFHCNPSLTASRPQDAAPAYNPNPQSAGQAQPWRFFADGGFFGSGPPTDMPNLATLFGAGPQLLPPPAALPQQQQQQQPAQPAPPQGIAFPSFMSFQQASLRRYPAELSTVPAPPSAFAPAPAPAVGTAPATLMSFAAAAVPSTGAGRDAPAAAGLGEAGLPVHFAQTPAAGQACRPPVQFDHVSGQTAQTLPFQWRG